MTGFIKNILMIYEELYEELIMFKVPTNKRASNIGPYLNFVKLLIPNVFFSFVSLVLAVKLF